MIFDKSAMFSDRQTINGGASMIRSTNVVDLGPVAAGIKRDIGKGTGIPILCQVVEDFSGTGTLRVYCEMSDVENFSSGGEIIWESPSIQSTKLKAGYVFVPEQVQRGVSKRYMRLSYQASNGMNGKLTAGITMGNQSNG